MSLATRLSAFFLAALAVVLLGFSATLYGLAWSYLHRQLDDRLVAALDTLEAAVDVEPDGLEWEPNDRRLTLGLEPDVEDVRWAIEADRGLEVDASANSADGAFPKRWRPAAWPSDPPDGTAFGDAPGWRLAGRRLRLTELLRLGRAHSEDDEIEDEVAYPVLFLTVGLSPGPVEAGLQRLGLTLAGLSAGLWLGAALLGRRLCRTALTPVTRMASAAREMSAAGLGERLPSPGTGDELEDLGRAFNELLARRHESFERQKQFAGDASHQLRTPLAGLLSLIEVIRRRKRPAEEYEQALDQVHREAVRLRQIVESLLFLARAEAEAGLPVGEPIDLADWVTEQLRRWADHPRGDVLREVRRIEGPLWIRAHPPLLSQLLDNLIDNAVKYSEPGRPITIRTRREGASVVLDVEDEGCGIAPEELSHLFEPFYRSPRARTQGRPGVGLGLAVAQRIATTLGGAVDVRSDPGRGSRFSVRFPEAKPPADPTAWERSPARPRVRRESPQVQGEFT